MITAAELLHVLLAPLIVSAVIAFIGRWRKWKFLASIAVGAAFMTGYGLIGVPKLPPSDGSDWLFWVTIPLTLVGIGVAFLPWKWSLWTGLIAGGATLAVLWPLVPGTVTNVQAIEIAAVFAAAGVVLSAALLFAESRIGPLAVVTTLWLVLSASAVVIMSSNFRIGGVYGIAAAAAVAGLIPVRPASARGPIVIALSLLIGLLVCGHFYPDPGVTWTNFIVLLASPLLLAIAGALPIKRTWVRAVIGIIAVAITIGAVTVPTALTAKHAAEDDPYAAGG